MMCISDDYEREASSILIVPHITYTLNYAFKMFAFVVFTDEHGDSNPRFSGLWNEAVAMILVLCRMMLNR